MDFETSGKGGNPFLMDDLGQYGGVTDQVGGGGGGGLNSNPFLSNSDFNVPATSENPFLSSIAGNEPSSFLASGNSSTNPFAQFDYSTNGGINTATTVDFFSTSESDSTHTNVFNAGDVTNAPSTDIFGSIPSSQPQTESKVSGNFDLLDDTEDNTPVESDLCKETDIFNSNSAAAADDSSRTSTPKGGPPRRPPPPRPVPPSKETKDLILSVTGAMEATSSHLLDRLQATRTPSPTPIRDLHSPSPTPDIPFSDLLGMDVTTAGQLPAFPSNTELNLLEEEPFAAAPSPPTPPPRPVPLSLKPAEPQQDIMNIFIGDSPAPSAVTAPQTSADILGLFDSSAPAVQTNEMTSKADLLLGDDFGGIVPAEPQEVNLLASTAMDLEPALILAQQQQQQQLQQQQQHQQQRQQPDNFMATDMLEATEAPTLKGADEFDAFAAKFENAAKEEGQEFCVVEGDPFDPFASSGLTADTGSNGEPSLSNQPCLNYSPFQSTFKLIIFITVLSHTNPAQKIQYFEVHFVDSYNWSCDFLCCLSNNNVCEHLYTCVSCKGSET
jgi:hypothetical protein